MFVGCAEQYRQDSRSKQQLLCLRADPHCAAQEPHSQYHLLLQVNLSFSASLSLFHSTPEQWQLIVQEEIASQHPPKFLKVPSLCRVGDKNAAQSAVYSFKTGKPIGPSSFPARIGLIADLGITSNSSVSLRHLAANNPEIALFVGGTSSAMFRTTVAPAFL